MGEVSKKKRKYAPFTMINDSGEDQTEPESTLVKKPKKAKQTELTTQATSASSQKDVVQKEGIK